MANIDLVHVLKSVLGRCGSSWQHHDFVMSGE